MFGGSPWVFTSPCPHRARVLRSDFRFCAEFCAGFALPHAIVFVIYLNMLCSVLQNCMRNRRVLRKNLFAAPVLLEPELSLNLLYTGQQVNIGTNLVTDVLSSFNAVAISPIDTQSLVTLRSLLVPLSTFLPLSRSATACLVCRMVSGTDTPVASLSRSFNYLRTRS